MVGMRAASTKVAFAWAALFVLLLALRVLASTGLMPVVDHGRLTIIACPDAADSAPLALTASHHHHHGQPGHEHNPCPYAAASWLSFVANDHAPLLALVILVFAAFTAAPMPVAATKRRHLRPPAIGPPLPA